jgi:hypothetical protein
MAVHGCYIRQYSTNGGFRHGTTGRELKRGKQGRQTQAQTTGGPYYRAVERDVHIGYRRNRPGITGSWSARRYLGEGRYDEAQLGAADDIHDADGHTVLDYWQAVAAARERAGIEPERTGPYTVEDAVNDYVEFLTHNRRTGYDVRVRMAAHVLPVLGRVSLDKLTSERLRKWHAGLVKQSPRLRTKPGAQQRHRDARRASAKSPAT